MNNKLDESEILDSFDPNRRGRRDMNPMFAKKDDRGGYHYRGTDGDRGGRKYENNRGREDNRNYGDNQRGRSGGYFRGNRDRDFGGENFRDNRGRDFRGGNYGDNRDRNFGGGNFRGNRDRDFRGGNFRGNRDRDYGGYRRGDFGRDRGRGMGRGRDFGGRNYGRGYNNTPFYHDDMGRDYDEMEDNFNRRRNYQRRTLFVGGLPRRINNIDLLRLFRPEGRIVSYRVMKNREGFSRGFGFVEFANPRDAWKSIQKWNNSFLDRNIIKVQFRRRVFNQRRFRNNNFNNRNNGRFNQGERGERNFGFRGERGGFRAGARPRGRF